MGKWSEYAGGVGKDGEVDEKPTRPLGSPYHPTSYFDHERWRKEKTAWVDRQEAREREGIGKLEYKPSVEGKLWFWKKSKG